MANSMAQYKAAPTESVFRFVNDSATPATFTITVPSMATPSQTIDGTPSASISALEWCTTANITITRNATLKNYLTGTGGLARAWGSDPTDKTADIVVSIASGTLEMRILKGPEFKNPA